MQVGDRIKELRVNSNMSAAELAVKTGKGESAVRMWESGKSKPDYDTLIKLADYFNCTTDYLLGKTDFKNVDDIRQNINTIEHLASNLNKMHSDDRKYLTHCLNMTLDYLLNSEFANNNGRNKVIYDLSDLILDYSEIFKSANKAHDNFQGSLRRLDLIYYVEFQKSVAGLIKKLEELENELLEYAFNGVSDNAMKKILTSSIAVIKEGEPNGEKD